MRNRLLFSFLPFLYKCPAPVIREQYGAAFTEFKAIRFYDTVIDQCQDKTISKTGAQFLHQIQRQRLPARSVPVQITYIGIQTDAFQCGSTIMRQENICKRKQRIERIHGRATASFVEKECFFSLQ